MPRISLCKPFSSEDVTKVSVTLRTADFDSAAIFIGYFDYSTREMIVKGWPAAASIKFCLGIVEGLIALTANIGTIFKKTVIFALEWGLGPLSEDYLNLFFIERVIRHETIITYQKNGFSKPK